VKSAVKNKKGLTLVELIAASAISVIIMAAACTMLYVGSKSARKGAAAFVNHGSAYTFETQLRNSLFEARDAAVYTSADSLPEPGDDNDIVEVYFDSEKVLWVKRKSKGGAHDSAIADDGIKEFKLEKKTVKDSSGSIISSVKPAVSYTITAKSDTDTLDFSGGITLNNVKDSAAFSLLDSTVIENTDTSTYFVMTVPKKE